MLEVEVIQDAQTAIVALDPARSRLLSELVVPASAATLATRLGVARQKINYHLRALEARKLVHVAETRHWGGLTERLLQASAGEYLVAPTALGAAAANPARARDRLSAGYLIALAGRVVREVGDMLKRSAEQGKHLASLSIDTEIRFRSAAERAAFSGELVSAVNALVARYHDANAPGGRAHRVIVLAHPSPQPPASGVNPCL
jgi:DNA-binding transcriptional ArsR family regulator